ncbi:MAG: ABC transporter substrate-binding protein [Chthoniobacteraceae bacterium]
MRDPVLGKNVKLRQAMSTVFDASKENDISTTASTLLAQQFLPPGLFGYDANFVNPYRQTSVEKAKKLLAEAGYANGINPKTGQPLQITMDVQASSGTERQVAEYEQGQFEQLGIRVKIQGKSVLRDAGEATPRAIPTRSRSAGAPIIPIPRTTSTCSTARASRPMATTSRSTPTLITTSFSSRCPPWKMARNALPSSNK